MNPPTPNLLPTPNLPPTPGPTPKKSTATPAPATSVCTHASSSPTWFEDQAAHFSWAVYCAVLPSGWSVDSASANYNSGGSITANYKSSGGATLTVKEMGSSAGIKLAGTDSGPVKFGDLNAELYDYGAGQYVVWASGGGGYYWAQSTGMSGMNLSDLMNNMHHVSK